MQIIREMDDISYPEEPLEYLSVRYSCPRWIIDLWVQTYSYDVIETVLKDFQEEKPVTIRCCMNRIEPGKLKERLEQEGVTVERHPYLPYAYWISGYDYLEGLDSFREGLFTVQDISSMMVGEIADPKAGDYVIDVCAAPGGKALHAAEKLLMAEKALKAESQPEVENTLVEEKETGAEKQRGQHAGHVEARDLTESKVALIRENIERTGLTNITAVCRDASVPDEVSAGQADVVIADLPCSGLGVFGKKPDLKYKASPEGIESLVKLQRQILSCARAYVKPGGALVYSTCTISPEENEGNVRWFLENCPEFSVDDIREKLAPQLQDSVGADGSIQFLPGVHKSDGFFIARFVRRK